MIQKISKGKKMEEEIKSRHENALKYAINQIKTSKLASYVQNLYLYGSYARGDYRWDSDIDLFLVLMEGAPVPCLKKEIIRLKGAVSQDGVFDVDVDLKIVYGDAWKSSSIPYYKSILKEGKNVWED